MSPIRDAIRHYKRNGFQSVLDAGLSEFLPGNIYRESLSDLKFKRRELPTVTDREGGHNHIILIVIDALRDDVVNSENTPHLNKLRESTAIAVAPWTYPSVTSILTGLYPHQHGAMRQNDSRDNGEEGGISLPPKTTHNTLPEYLYSAGYETYGGFGFRMPFLALSGRFKKHKLYNKCSAERLISEYKHWFRKHKTKKTFSYLHFADLHHPLNPPSKYWTKYDVNKNIDGINNEWICPKELSSQHSDIYQKHKKRLYRASANYIDEQIHSLLSYVEQKTPSEPIIIVTGDHGEAFWEWADFDAEHFYNPRPKLYGAGHGHTPYESVAKVPIMSKNIKFNSQLCSTIDIHPTLLSVNNIQVEKNITGLSHIDKYPAERKLLIEAARYGHEKKAVYENDIKLIHSKGDKKTFSFEIPEENITEIPIRRVEKLKDEFPPWPEGGEVRKINKKVQNRLESLGYQ